MNNEKMHTTMRLMVARLLCIPPTQTQIIVRCEWNTCHWSIVTHTGARVLILGVDLKIFGVFLKMLVDNFDISLVSGCSLCLLFVGGCDDIVSYV